MAGNNLYMPVWIDAYHADTRHLSTVQHGAYLLILMSMWRNGGKLKNDEKALARIAGLTLDKWRRYGGDVMDLLAVEDGFVSQKRLLQELNKSRSNIEKKRTAGKAGGLANSLKNKGSIPADAEADAVSVPEQTGEQKGKQTGSLYSLLSTPSKKPSVSVEEGASADEPLPWEVELVVKDAKPETKPEPKPVAVKDYAIDQGKVRLTYDDLERWQTLYPSINVAGEVTGMAGWLNDKAREGKNWFQIAQGALNKRDRERRKEIEDHRIKVEAAAKHGAVQAAAPRNMAI
jgi:uncharacterized protein YdaU (DUF1376 family)